eukprot:2361026-Amphidinium_carterae.2
MYKFSLMTLWTFQTQPRRSQWTLGQFTFLHQVWNSQFHNHCQPEAMPQETIPELLVQAPHAAVDTAPYKPTHRLTGKQPPPQQPVRAIVTQLDDITSTEELRLENNEDKEENDEWSQSWQVQPGFQYEDDITMFSENS